MGRSLKDASNRRKGPAGTGQSRKREKRIRQRMVKDQQEQLAVLHNKRKKRLEHESSQGKGDAKATTSSTGFEKAIAHEASHPVPFKRCFWRGSAPLPGEPSDDLKLQRKQIGVKVRGAPTPPPVSSFSDGSLPKEFSDFKAFCSARSGSASRVEHPTPIQAQVWPAALCGLDVIGIAPTGSGKTLAYILPAVPHILGRECGATTTKLNDRSADEIGAVCLSLVPTRELAKQVCDACGGGGGSGTGGGWLKRLFALRAGAVYGGVGKEEQLDSIVTLGPPHILCATPGRLLDLLGLAVLSLSRVTYLVLDEADRMLALGFETQLTAIMKAIRPNRQALLFSATFPGKLREAAEQWMAAERVIIRVAALEVADSAAPHEATEGDGSNVLAAAATSSERAEEEQDDVMDVGPGGTSSTLTVSSTVHQTVHVCADHKKHRKLLQFIEKVREGEKSSGSRTRSAILIFCAQIKTLNTVQKMVANHGERCAPLHSGIPQAKREQSLADLKAGKVNTLVATDVASRGLHISRLRHVINYDFPSNLEIYCHRIGRVGRQGVEGWAYSFFTRNLAPLAAGLIGLLEKSHQFIDPNLKELAAEYQARADASGGAANRDSKTNSIAKDPVAEGSTTVPMPNSKRKQARTSPLKKVLRKDDVKEKVQEEDVEDGTKKEIKEDCSARARAQDRDDSSSDPADIASASSAEAGSSDGAPKGIGIGGGLCIRPRKKKQTQTSQEATDSSNDDEEAKAKRPHKSKGVARKTRKRKGKRR